MLDQCYLNQRGGHNNVTSVCMDSGNHFW